MSLSPLSFGAQLKNYRKALGLTQKALGACAGCTVIALQKLEADARRPSPELAAALARCLGLMDDARAQFLSDAQINTGDERSSLSLTPPPTWLTSWVDRDQVVTLAQSLLEREDVRLLTLVGPAGSGKTRLATHLAQALAASFADGVCFVNLAPVQHPNQVANAIAQAFSLKDRAGNPSSWERVIGVLRNRHLLLLLDNFEHVLSAAPLIGELLQHCLHIRVVVTSRCAMRLSGEHECPVGTLGAAAASSLFAARAQAVQPQFALTQQNQATVAEVCAQLDYLPLAIELAAARINLLSPETMLTQLRADDAQSRFVLLADGATDAPARQHTLWQAIHWSYHLLDGESQRCFAALGACVGGFDVALARAVFGVDEAQALNRLQQLVSHNLVVVASNGCYALLESLCAFAQKCLRERDEDLLVHRAHAQHLEKLAISVRPMISNGMLVEAGLAMVRRDLDNFRVAMAWLLAHDEVVLAARLSASLWQAMWLLGHWHEALSWLERVLSALDINQPDHQRPYRRALSAAGSLAVATSQMNAAQRYFEHALEHNRHANDANGLSVVLGNLSLVYLRQGRYDAAEALMHECLELDRQSGDEEYIGIDLNQLGELALLRGNPILAERLFLECLALFNKRGSKSNAALAQYNLGKVRVQLGDLDSASTLFQRVLDWAHEMAARHIEAQATFAYARVLHCQGEAAQASALIVKVMPLFEECGAQVDLCEVYHWAGCIALEQVNPAALQTGVCLMGAAQAIQRRFGIALGVGERAEGDAALATARKRIGEARVEILLLEGAALSFEDVLDLVKRIASASAASSSRH
jgi:predicted ATPase/DNA-binding XRE family transcriptional regulator